MPCDIFVKCFNCCMLAGIWRQAGSTMLLSGECRLDARYSLGHLRKAANSFIGALQFLVCVVAARLPLWQRISRAAAEALAATAVAPFIAPLRRPHTCSSGAMPTSLGRCKYRCLVPSMQLVPLLGYSRT
jgi:hypothetical protein